MFCGGRKCKYELSSTWTDQHKALPGIFSHWVTDDIVAMARPNTDLIHKHDLIQAFHKNNIKSIINLQEPGEHASCGNGLMDSGFSYDPILFMENKVYFYNFQWKDYSIVSDEVLLDMVKVLTFALTEGKVAVHCHAGLGRTGVLIASYLVFALRIKPHDAIRYVRSKRPNSIQTRGQILSVLQFSQYVLPLFVIYQHIISRQMGLSLSQILVRQRMLLHGYELRHLKHIPKIIYMICERLLKLCAKHKTYSRGINTGISGSANDIDIDYQLDKSDSFSKYFFSSLTASAADLFRPNHHRQNRHNHHQRRRSRRPLSDNTVALTSGIGSPSTDLTTELDTIDDDSPKILRKTIKTNHRLVEQNGTLSAPQSALSAVDGQLLTVDSPLSAPMLQINSIGLQSPIKLATNGHQLSSSSATLSQSSDDCDGDDEQLDSSLSESMTSLIESLGYRVVKIDSSQMLYEQDIQFTDNNTNNDNNKNQLNHTLNDKLIDEEFFGRNKSSYDNEDYDDVSDESVTVDDPLDTNNGSSGFVSSVNTGNSEADDDADHMPVDPKQVVKALVSDYTVYSKPFGYNLMQYQKELNTKPMAWDRLSRETNVEILGALLWSWIDSLSDTVLTKTALCHIVVKAEVPVSALLKLDQSARYTLEYLLRFIARLSPDQDDRALLLRHLMARLTRQKFKISDERSVPDSRDWPEMRKGTAGRILLFADGLYQMFKLN